MDLIDGKWLEERIAGERGVQAKLAVHMGLTQDKLSKVLAGVRRLSAAEMQMALDFFAGADPQEQAETGGGSATLIPIYSVQASAGPGALVTAEDIVDRLAFPPDYLRHITKSHPRHLAIIGVKGDSMAPTLKDDDLVMIDTSKIDLSFEGLFVIRIDGGAALLVKRIGRASQRGFVKLISDNPSHPAVDVAAEDVVPVGKVVWAGVKV